MLRRALALPALVAALGGFVHDDAWAHAGVRFSDPVAGATLGDTPTEVRLSFWEKPEPSLTDVRVSDTTGAVYQIGRPGPVAGQPLSLAVRVRPLPRGVYTVNWRSVSAVDGHAVAGAYAFGVLVSPVGAATVTAIYPVASSYEMLARFIFILGLVVLLGSASAEIARFGGGTGGTVLGVPGWILAGTGLILLADAQRRSAAAPLGALLATSIGRALVWRAVALGCAGIALLATRFTGPRFRRLAMAGVGLATLMVMAVHAANGHAGAAQRWPWALIAAQWAHFAAAGFWLGGLAALLIGVRGSPSAEKASAVARFSRIAAAGLVVVTATGVARSLEAVSSWDDLISTDYGRVVLVKIAVLAAIAACGAFNHWRSVPAAAATLRPLRWTAGGELVLASGALAAAAVLGALPPPSAGRLAAPTGLVASGSDFGTTVLVRLTTPSDQPGPNRFVVHAVDYDSKAPVRARRVSLRFTPLDDPGVAPTTLTLLPGPGDSYTGSGANLAFDGRWQVTARIERLSDSVEVPLEVETRTPPQFTSIERIRGEAPKYTVQLPGGDYVRISPDPERPGRSAVHVTYYDLIGDERQVEDVVVTSAAGSALARPNQARRVGPGEFVAEVELRPGLNRIAAIVRQADGARFRAAVEIEVPDR